MPKAKSKKAKARPPRLYFDKAKQQHFVRVAGKKVYYPKGSDPKKLIEQLLQKVRTTEPTKRKEEDFKEVIFYDKNGTRPKAKKEPNAKNPFRGQKYRWTGRYVSDPPLVSYSSLDPTTQRILQKQAENSLEAEKKAAAADSAVKATALANEESKKNIAALKADMVPVEDVKKLLSLEGSYEDRQRLLADKANKLKTEQAYETGLSSEARASARDRVADLKSKIFSKTDQMRDEAKLLERDDSDDSGSVPITLSGMQAMATRAPLGRQRQLVQTNYGLASDIDVRPDNLEDVPLPELEDVGSPAPTAAAAAAIANQTGDGRLEDQVRDVGLYSDQILKMMKNYVQDGFVGVVAADELGLLIKNSLKHDKFGFVMNKDPSDKAGSHWVGVYIDTVGDKAVEYFDSYAEEPDDLFLSELKKLLQAHKLDIYLKFKVNRVKSQAENSNLCGFHAMKFLMDRFADKPFIDASGWSDVRKREHEAKQLMEKFDRFGYI